MNASTTFLALLLAGLPQVVLSQTAAEPVVPQTSSTQAGHIHASVDPMDMVNMPSVGPLFLENSTFSTTVTVVNAGIAPVTGLVMIRALDGSLLTQKSVPIVGHSNVALKVNDLLTAAGSQAQQGRVELYDDTTEGSALVGQLTIGYSDRGKAHIIDEELSMPSMTSSHALRGIAVGSTGAPYVAVTNPTMQAEDVTANCYPEGAPSQQLHLSIPPEQTALLQGCTALTGSSDPAWLAKPAATSSSGSAYAIELVSTTAHAEIEAFGLAAHTTNGAGDWTSINFFDPDKYASPLTIFAGIPVGTTPLLWGTYTPRLALHNFAGDAQTVNVRLASMNSGFAVVNTVATLTLQPSESRSLDIPQTTASNDSLNTLTVEASGAAGGVTAQLLLEDGSQDIRMQLIGKSGADDTNTGMHPWKISDDEDSVLLLYNQTSTSQKALLRIGNGQTVWQKSVTLNASATQSFSVKGLLAAHSKDDSGKEFVKGDGLGEFSWSADDKGRLKGRLLRLNNATHTGASFQCAAYSTLCEGVITGPSSLTIGDNGTWQASAHTCFNYYASNFCDGIPTGYGAASGYSWGTSGLDLSGDTFSPSISGKTTGGNVFLNVNMTSFAGCVVSANTTVTVTGGYPPAAVQSLSSYIWQAGTTFPLTITGTGFGTNPTVTISAVGVAPVTSTVNSDGMHITLPAVTVAANAPYGTATVTVKPGYTGQTFICGSACNGGTGEGSATATVQPIVAPPPPSIIIGTDASQCGTASNIAQTTQQVFIGQRVTFTACIPTMPSGLSITNGSQAWTPSTPASSISLAGFSVTRSGSEYTEKMTPTSNTVCAPNSTSCVFDAFYFTAPTQNNQTFTFAYTTSNGQAASASVSYVAVGPTSVVVSNTIGQPVFSVSNGEDFLNLGTGFGNGSGVSFKATVPSTPSGSYFWVQIIQSRDVYDLGTNGRELNQSVSQALDTSYPYTTGTTMRDSPGIPLATEIFGEEEERFIAKSYLMWTPQADSLCSGNNCVIDVPIGTVLWGYINDAINTLNVAVYNTPTSSVHGWILSDACSNKIANAFTPSSDNSGYPNWSSTIH